MVEELIMKSLKEYGIMDVQLLRLQRSGPIIISLSEYCPTRLPAVLVGEYSVNSEGCWKMQVEIVTT